MKPRSKKQFRQRRHFSLRKKVIGTAARPRMSVFRSNTALYVQFIDDDAGQTLAAVSVKSKNVAAATDLGRQAAEAILAKDIDTVVFDRGGFAYGTVLSTLADSAREAGLKF